jgi:hypothetical protein
MRGNIPLTDDISRILRITGIGASTEVKGAYTNLCSKQQTFQFWWFVSNGEN